MDYGFSGNLAKAESLGGPYPLKDRLKAERDRAVANVNRLNELLDLLESNPDLSRALELLQGGL